MILLKILICLALPFALTGTEMDYIKLADRLTLKHIQHMQRKGFYTSLFGGKMMDDLKGVALGFQMKKSPTVDEVREIFINGAEDLLKLMNTDKQIRPYLHDFPFTINNLEYSLTFERIKNENLNYEPVGYASNCRGKILYRAYDESKPSGHQFQMLHEESYEQALKIVREQEAKAKDNL